MELVTGAAVSLVSEETYNQHWPQQHLEESNTRLKTYSGEYLETLGNISVSVCYGDQQVTLPLVVIKGKGPSLFGRNWLEKIKLDWPEIHKLQEDPVGAILRQHAIVFEESPGTLKGFTAQVHMSQAYQQILLDEPSKNLVVINTPKGLYNRLPFGISCAPGIFQRVMDSLLKGIPGVVVYLDDILITGPSEEEHLSSLKQVLTRLQGAGLRLNKKKCNFLVPSVTYLGYRIDSEGLHPTDEKLKAVQQVPAPTGVTELKAYLGLLIYYGRFLPHLPSVLAPLYTLSHKDAPWRWTTVEQESFKQSKELLLSSTVLVHFNPDLPIVLACDAS